MMSKLSEVFNDCMDFQKRSFCEDHLQVAYLSTLIGNDELVRELLHPLSKLEERDILNLLTTPPFQSAVSLDECIKGVLEGKAALCYKERGFLIDIHHVEGRSIQESSIEGVISGPHDGFVENITQNISLIRNRVKSEHLKTFKLTVGSLTKTDVVLVYLDDIVNQNLLADIKKKLQAIRIKAIYGTPMITQLIEENPGSIFPQFVMTERPDSSCSQIVQGRIVCLVDGSPSAFSLPTSFFEFFSSPEDYYQRWLVGSSLRLFRFLGLFICLVFTPLYIAVTTFHYEIIPFNMLLNLTESRRKVPFPPLLEALIMELTIEMLKEAGGRMPAKIGQTIGIVGGIVIGQAAVQAGITSNILIISVAVSAIASFMIPNFIMSNSVRFLRFLLLFLAGFTGIYGIVMGIGLIIAHLASISNMGTSYLDPVAPMKFREWLDTFIRGPIQTLKNEPTQPKENK